MQKTIILLLAGILIFSSCTTPGVNNPGGTASDTPAVTVMGNGTPTGTIIWFPATATWTPFPTVKSSATPQLLPGIGPQIYRDDFSEQKTWSLARTELAGSNGIILDNYKLTLAVNEPPAVLFSINNILSLTDFHAEVIVSVNRCEGQDAYGMLFRTASGAYTYRYILNCSGKVRVDQTRDGRTLPLQDWVPSGDAPSGAPGQVKMGVWAAGSELRFFLNGRYQFTVLDSLFRSGSLGFYVNAVSPNGMNINFSGLTINSVDYASPTPTVTPSKTSLPTRTPRPIP